MNARDLQRMSIRRRIGFWRLYPRLPHASATALSSCRGRRVEARRINLVDEAALRRLCGRRCLDARPPQVQAIAADMI